jgi:G6PDH family F420-dependent oxidoreductase
LGDLKDLKISADLGENEKEPSEFLDCVTVAEKVGFDSAFFGDHFMPWVHDGGKSAFVWSLMSSALERTNKIKVGPLVTVPIGARYHPAIIAQAASTIDSLYPGRFLLTVGTGEAVNEAFFLEWPEWDERIERLTEGITLMRKLWSSDSYFDFDGKYFKMNQVYLYTKPKTVLEVYFSGIGPKSAYFAGKYGDHLVTLSSHNSLERCRDVIFPSCESGARASGKDPKDMEKVVSLSFSLEDKESYLLSAKKTAGTDSWDETDPRKIGALGATVPQQKLLKLSYLCSNWTDVIDLVSRFHEAGTTHIILQPGANQENIKMYAEKILRHFRT